MTQNPFFARLIAIEYQKDNFFIVALTWKGWGIKK